jgi:xanthine dehydrogenase accessory factor
MEFRILKQLNAAKADRKPVALLTELGSGRQRLLSDKDEVAGALGDHVSASFRSGQSVHFELGNERYFLEVQLPAPRMVIIGAVHIAQALAPMAAISGFDVTIVDPRPSFATPERFAEGQKVVCEWPEDWLESNSLDEWTAVTCFTHEPNIDDHALATAMDANCFYIGALGGRKSHGKRLERLGKLGYSSEKTNQICGPIGLDIGSSTPPEIAVATLAQVISKLRKA